MELDLIGKLELKKLTSDRWDKRLHDDGKLCINIIADNEREREREADP